MNYSNTSLPAELTDRILDFLHSQPATLAACARSGKTLLQTCRWHLYHVILLPNRQLEETLTQSEVVGRMVREIRIGSGPPESRRDPSDYGHESTSLPVDFDAERGDQAHLRRILSCENIRMGLQTLKIGVEQGGHGVDWDRNIETGLQEAIYHLPPTVRVHLGLSGKFPHVSSSGLFSALSGSLTRLVLPSAFEGVCCWKYLPDSDGSECMRPRLHALVLNVRGWLWRDPASVPFDCSTVTQLAISVADDGIRGMGRMDSQTKAWVTREVLDLCQDSLQLLILWYSKDLLGHIGNLPLHLTRFCYATFEKVRVDWLIAMLQSGHAALEILELIGQLDVGSESRGGWDVLDSMLSDANQFPALKSVSIYLSHPGIAWNLLPRLQNRRNVNILTNTSLDAFSISPSGA